jgi:uncharacterized MnhB-related membrane protein
MLNSEEIMKRVIKYIIQGLMVAIACYAIPKQNLALEEIGLIALIASLTFSILDTYIPTMNKYN